MLILPVQVYFGEPILAYNLSLLSTFPLAAFGMYLLAFHWTHHRQAAFVAGLIFAFTPYRFAAIAHLQLLTFQWMPYLLLFLDKLMVAQTLKVFKTFRVYGICFILFLVMQCLAAWYLAIYTGVIVAIYVMVAHASLGLTQDNRSATAKDVALHVLRKFCPLLLISGLLILPLAWPYLSIVNELRQARPLNQALELVAVPTDFVAAAPFNYLFGSLTATFRQRPQFTEENMLFSGFIAPLLALLALFSPATARPKVYALSIILLFTLSLTFATPYTTLAKLMPPATIIRVPPRWIIPALFALAGLAAFGVKNFSLFPTSYFLPPTSYLLLPTSYFLLPTLLLTESFSVPLPLAPVNNHTTLNPAYHWLAKNQKSNIALLELPLHSAPAPEYPEVKRLYASTLGWWRLVNGYSGYTPPRQPKLAQAVAEFPNPSAMKILQTLAEPLPLFLLIHPDEAPFNRSHWEDALRWQAERQADLLPLGQFGHEYLYQVMADPSRFSQPPVAVFNQTIKLLAVKFQANGVLLYWQTTAPLPTAYTVFIHLRATDGFVRAQADSPPVSNHYPTTAWPVGEIIQDLHALPATEFDHLAIGLYDPSTAQRLPAFTVEGRRLPADALIIPAP